MEVTTNYSIADRNCEKFNHAFKKIQSSLINNNKRLKGEAVSPPPPVLSPSADVPSGSSRNVMSGLVLAPGPRLPDALQAPPAAADDEADQEVGLDLSSQPLITTEDGVDEDGGGGDEDIFASEESEKEDQVNTGQWKVEDDDEEEIEEEKEKTEQDDNVNDNDDADEN
ncbi:unnamed protein product [Orchesella dallaii]|uniref:Uncharacterized protein n=1 Tax=Orchesella dallaii TaxID=48710 RepID=A0ABP1R297_9HEXA